LPVAFQNEPPEKLQAVSIDFYGTPRMGFDQLGKIGFQLGNAQSIRTAVIMIPNPPNSPCIGVNRFLAFPLQLEQLDMTVVQLVESFGF
jgi:hypothetical protein